jgi:hypothetical protein
MDAVKVQTLRKSRGLNSGYSEGAYRSGAHTGLLAGVGAGTATVGHIWTARWAPPGTNSVIDIRRRAIIQRLRIRWFTVAGFTAAQEVGLELFRLTAYTAAYSGGTGAAVLTPSPKLSAVPTSLMTGRIAGSDALTAGTQTLDTDPIGSASFAELAAAATVPKGSFEIFLSTEDLDRHPIILAPNEGLVIRNLVAMGAGGTARVSVEMDWLEVERY